nr:uncharacterized protein LOC129265380 [Lytechinus pictus]
MVDLMLTSLHIYLPVLLMLCTLATCKCEVAEQNITGWLGQDDVRLPCNFIHQDVIVALYWSKQKDPTKAGEVDSTKASYFKKQLNSLEDRFTLNEDFSLSISDLQVADEGRYLCQVEFESDRSLLKYQTLTVYARVSTPEIEQCDQEPTGNESHTFCTMKTPNTQPFDLTCRVTGFKPNVTLQWMSSVDTMQSDREPYQLTLLDGTLEQKITIIVTAQPDMDQPYTCTVNGEATNGTERSSTITVRYHPVI